MKHELIIRSLEKKFTEVIEQAVNTNLEKKLPQEEIHPVFPKK